MYIRIGRVRIHIGFPFAAFCAYAANSKTGTTLMLVFVAALLHEAGHTAALIRSGDEAPTLYLSPGGARIESRLLGELPYKRDAAVALAGPAVNLSLALLLYVAYIITDGEVFIRAAETNFALGFVNLLPLSFLDGGRILYDILLLHTSEIRADRVCAAAGSAVFACLTALFAFLTARGENTVFLAVFLVYCILQKTLFRHLQKKT